MRIFELEEAIGVLRRSSSENFNEPVLIILKSKTIGDDGASELARAVESSRLPRGSYIVLRKNGIRRHGAKVLARAVVSAQLPEDFMFSIAENEVDSSFLSQFVSSRRIYPKNFKLKIETTFLCSRGVQDFMSFLARNHDLPEGISFSLSYPVNFDVYQDYIRPPDSGLCNDLVIAIADLLRENWHLPEGFALSISGFAIDLVRVRVLRDALKQSRLPKDCALSFSDANIGDDGACIFADVMQEAQHLPEGVFLGFAYNNITVVGLSAFAQAIESNPDLPNRFSVSFSESMQQGDNLIRASDIEQFFSREFRDRYQIQYKDSRIYFEGSRLELNRFEEMGEEKIRAPRKPSKRSKPRTASSSMSSRRRQTPNRGFFADQIPEHYRISPNEITENEIIGEGGFGEVVHGMYGNQEVAIKRYKGDELPKKVAEEVGREVNIMIRLHHECLIRLLGVVLDENLPPKLVMEYMPGGSLYYFLHHGEEITEALQFQIANDMARGLAYLHDRNPSIIHSDLKSLNVLLDQYCRAKLADFGLSRLKKHVGTTSTLTSGADQVFGGTLRWMAPELFSRNTSKPTEASDVWAFGMILFELVTRELPFDSASDNEQIKDWIKEGDGENVPDDCPAGLGELMAACWRDRIDRPSADDLVRETEALLGEGVSEKSRMTSSSSGLFAKSSRSSGDSSSRRRNQSGSRSGSKSSSGRGSKQSRSRKSGYKSVSSEYDNQSQTSSGSKHSSSRSSKKTYSSKKSKGSQDRVSKQSHSPSGSKSGSKHRSKKSSRQLNSKFRSDYESSSSNNNNETPQYNPFG
ncbi:MAG: protein kinase [Gammaproteobacteria bacterium]